LLSFYFSSLSSLFLSFLSSLTQLLSGKICF
jgi:hypothetical protein